MNTVTRPHAHRPKSATEIAAQRQAEDAARQRDLYGDALPAKELLQRRGFPVNREGPNVRVGSKLMTLAEMEMMAEREAGLAGMAAPVRRVVETANGLRVGQAIAIVPKAAARPALTPRMVEPKAVRPPPKPMLPAHSADLGTRPRVVWLDLGLLTIDKRYQRDIAEGGQQHINRIRQGFNWNCYQPIVVTEGADGTYAVIDGQHRLEAAKKHPLIDSLPCYIIDAPEVTQQAQIFVDVNSNRRGLTSSQKFWASHAAGEKSAVALADICKAAGVTILRGPPGTQIPPLSILGPLVCQRLIVRFGAGPVREAILLLAETHSKTLGAFRSATVSALVRIATGKGYSRDALRRVLIVTNLAELQGQASALTSGGGVSSLTLGTEKLLRAAIEGKAAAA